MQGKLEPDCVLWGVLESKRKEIKKPDSFIKTFDFILQFDLIKLREFNQLDMKI